MTIELRPYQLDLVERLRAALRQHRSVVAVAPTGSGKTALAAYMIGRAAERGRRVWMTVHRDFLLTQTAVALNDAGVDHGFIASGYPFNPYQQVHVVSINTAVRRLAKLTAPDLLVIDECHHAPATSWAAVHQWAGTAHMVGLTATPARLDGRGLATFFSAMVRGPTAAWLIERGFLSRYRAFAPGSPDLAGVHSRAGDYVTRELAAVMDTSTIAGNVVEQYRKHAAGKRAIYYGVSVEHSQHLAAAFQTADIAACHLDGKSSPTERLDAAAALGEGRIAVICNCELFGEGFDLASLAAGAVIEAVGLCRPTQSLTLHLQQIGRALRPKPEPAIILDHAGNLVRHGLPDEPRQWSLDGITRKARAADDDDQPIHICESCYAAYPTQLRVCPECGAERPAKIRAVEEIAADLVEADLALIRAARLRQQSRATSLEDLRALAAARGYRSGWADHVYRARMARQR